MPTRVVHLWRTLHEPPAICALPGFTIRTYRDERDIDVWVELRARAFADQKPAVRAWSKADFADEYLAKPWWSPDRLWLAEATGEAVGSVTLAFRGRGAVAMPVVHWLMVAPEWRRRAVGKLLIGTLESACWQAGYRRVALETHAGWAAAERFYRSLGYGDCTKRNSSDNFFRHA
jgi:GNAT superfamily N-acetyltransferase